MARQAGARICCPVRRAARSEPGRMRIQSSTKRRALAAARHTALMTSHTVALLMAAHTFGEVTSGLGCVMLRSHGAARPNRRRRMQRAACRHIAGCARCTQPQALVAAQTERLLTVTRSARGSILLGGDRMRAQPVARVNIAWPQAPVVTALTLAHGVTSFTSTRIVAGHVPVPIQPIVAVQQRWCRGAWHQQFSREPRAHSAAFGFVTDCAIRSRLAIDATAAASVTANTEWFRRKSFRTKSIRQAFDARVTLCTTDIAPSMLCV